MAWIRALVMMMAGLAVAPMLTAETLHYRSGGRDIAVDVYAPEGAGNRVLPGVVVLHGSDGFILGGLWYKYAARNMAKAGYRTYLIHYFNRTGDWSVRDHGEIHDKTPVWAETVTDGLDFVAAQPGVDGQRLGIVGISLGGGVGLAAAANDARVKAVVDYFGFMPKTLTATDTLPPVLIVHGEADTTVPVRNAYAIEAYLKQQRVPYVMKIYPGKGHGFRGEAGADADRRTRDFLKTYLEDAR